MSLMSYRHRFRSALTKREPFDGHAPGLTESLVSIDAPTMGIVRTSGCTASYRLRGSRGETRHAHSLTKLFQAFSAMRRLDGSGSRGHCVRARPH